MLFIDLKKLKIVKEFNYQTFETEMQFGINDAAAKIKAEAKKIAAQLLTQHASVAAKYVINVYTDITPLAEDVVSYVNIITAAFFEEFVLTGGRPRERRLDIPQEFQCVHISAGLLKRAINTKTVTDIFNLEINVNNVFHYTLVDKKEK